MSPILGIYASQDYVRIPPSSFESIATFTGSGQTSVTFSAIPSTYVALQLRMILRKDATDSFFYIQPNAATGSVYTFHQLEGYGTGVVASGFATGTYTNGPYLQLAKSNDLASTFGAAIVDFQDYASTSKNKTIRMFSGIDKNGDGNIDLQSSLWVSTTAISSLKILSTSGGFATGSSISLYGIKG